MLKQVNYFFCNIDIPVTARKGDGEMDCQSEDMYFLKNLCFLCLRDDTKNLKSILILDEKNISTHEKLEFCMSESMNIHLGIPRLICGICQQYINFIFIFKQKCIENSIRLKEYVEMLQLNKTDKFNSLSIYLSNVSQNKLKSSENEKNEESINEFITETTFPLQNCALVTENVKVNYTGNETELTDINENKYLYGLEENEKNDDIVIKKELTELELVEDNNIFTDDIDIKEEFIDFTEYKYLYNEILYADEIKYENITKTERQDPPNAVSVISQTCPNIILNDEFQILSNLKDDSINNNTNKQVELIVANNDSKSLQQTSNYKNETTPENKQKFKRIMSDDDYTEDSDSCSDISDNDEDPQIFDIYKMKRNKITDKYHCFFCSKTYSKSTKLDIHMRKYHIEDKPFHCKYCPEKFQFRRKFNYHVLHAHQDVEHACAFCGKTFLNVNVMKKHLKIHGEKQYQCKFCAKKFVRKIHLINHETTHTGEKLFDCPQCDKKFSTKNNLDCHYRTHTGTRPYVCSICGQGFKDWKGRQYHMDMHAEIKRFSCKICSSKFRSSSQLALHVRTHSDERPYLCTVCNKWYKKKSYLKEHMQKHITATGRAKKVIEKVKCTICENFYGKGPGMIAHMKSHEKKLSNDTS